MKFQTTLDAQTFLLEILKFDKITEVNETYVPTSEEMDLFIKHREPLVKRIKNYAKSSAQKANWRQNRTNMMKGIKSFHRSVDGKRFHRRLGRFLSTRITKDRETNEGYQTLLAKQEYLKGINSAKQHLFVELEYFHQLEAQVEIEEMILEYAIPFFRSIEEKIITNEELTDDELVFLMDLTEEKTLIQSIAEKLGKEFAEIENLWNSI